MDSQIENKIRVAASFKSMAAAALNAGKIDEADAAMKKFCDSMKAIYNEAPDLRTKKGYFTGVASLALHFLQQDRYQDAMEYCGEAFELISELYDESDSADNALGVVQMASQYLICCFETEQFDNVPEVYDTAKVVADRLKAHFSGNEQVQMILQQFDQFRQAIEG